MKIKIETPSRAYIAGYPAECKDGTDRFAFTEAHRTNEIVTVGQVTAIPMNRPLAVDFHKQRLLEVRFPGKPSENTRELLKSRGFWWSKSDRCWWLAKPVSLIFVRNEPVLKNGFEYALDALLQVGLTPEQRTALIKEHDDHFEGEAIRGMEEACGIA